MERSKYKIHKTAVKAVQISLNALKDEDLIKMDSQIAARLNINSLQKC